MVKEKHFMEKVHRNVVVARNVARNVVIFGVDYSSLSQTNNRKNNVLVLGKGPTQEINDTTGAAEKKICINICIENTKFCLSLHYNGDESYLHANKTDL